MEVIAQNIQILPEKTLKDIAKGPLVKFTSTCTDEGSINRVWQSLLETLSTPALPLQQTSAACNATSAFLDAAVESPIEHTRQLALSPQVWLAVFDAFIARFGDVKPKPLKQLLSSIMAIFVNKHHGETRALIKTAVFDAILPCTILGEARSRQKGSLVVLEMFIRKEAIPPSELIAVTRNWLLTCQEKWVTLFKKDYQVLYPGASDPTVMSGEPSDEVTGRVFVHGLLTQTNDRGMSGTSGSILASLVEKLKAEKPEQPLSWIWVYPARNILLQNLDTVHTLAIQVIQPLFTLDPIGFTTFVQTLPLNSLMAGDMVDASQSEYMLLFVSLQVGKQANLVHDDYDASKEPNPYSLVLKSDLIGKFLLHRDQTIRVAALALLVTAFSTMKPFTKAATEAILHGLPSIHADCNAHSRGEIMGLTRKFITRLKSGILTDGEALKVLQGKGSVRPSSLSQSESETKAFLGSYLNFIQGDLCVTASYPRHIAALKSLKLLLESGLDPLTDVKPPKAEAQATWKLKLNIFSPRLLRLLVDLLLDPFEEVRHTSLLLLNLFPSEVLTGDTVAGTNQQKSANMSVLDALDRAESIASNTSRADHADTVARLYHILFSAAQSGYSTVANMNWWTTKHSVVNIILDRLEERVSSSKGLFGSTMQQAPLHGYMSGLRYIVLSPNFYTYISTEIDASAWKRVHDRIFTICEKVWQEVKPVLCIDSPEGHTDDPIEDVTVGPKDMLSYAWRSLRESSLLLHATMANISYGPSNTQGLQRSDFEKIGRLSFIQLAELRHRGAFSTVSMTFATCCQRCSTSADPSIKELPVSWYQDAKATMFEYAAKLTRRSAGLPALVTGVLCSCTGTPFFKQVMNELIEISHLPTDYDKDQQYLKLPQVHMMNCLKDIFDNNKLGPHADSFIMPALTLSAERLGSPIWNLRNSGLMLFRALLQRICRSSVGAGAGFGGISGAEPGAKISFSKYPGLLELLSSLLAPTEGTTVEGTDIVTERIFPALELIGEKIPTSDDEYDTTLRGLVFEHFKSPVWGIREHAARVYASLLTRSNILKDVSDLLSRLNPGASENYLHGTALCVLYSLRRFADSTDVFWASNIQDTHVTIRQTVSTILSLARSPFVATVIIEILNDSLIRSMDAGIDDQASLFLSNVWDENDIHGITGYVFDSSRPGWNLESRTRASSLLRRDLAWCKVLNLLASGEWNEISTFMYGVASFDADAVYWILEQLDEKLGDKERYRKPLVDLYSTIILRQFSADVKTIAVSNLSSSVDHLLASRYESIAELALPCHDLLQMFKPDLNIQTWNRQATDAEMRLQGCLLGVQFSLVKGQDLSPFKSTLYRWTVKLRSALSEETEFTTRYSAAVSIQSFSRGLRPTDSPPRVDHSLLDVYLILYDMLNDDDDEIRDVAASTASWILSYSSVSPRTAVALGPLNASSLLATFIADNYSDSPQLARRAIKYLAGQQPRISELDRPSQLVPVADSITNYCQESTVLFVEEKQNLFVDEVREADIWSKTLLRLHPIAYPETAMGNFLNWVSEGLTYLANLASQDAGRDGLLGWTSKPECFTLGVRIISISCALASPGFKAPEYMDPITIRKQLQSLLKVGQAASVHDEWLSRIESGLSSNI